MTEAAEPDEAAAARPTDVLVAGIGNIFFRDDGFGPAVATHLGAMPLPGGARVVDYGIRGLHLSYDLLDGVGALVLVDAVPAPDGDDAAPGTVLTMQIDPDAAGDAPVDGHSLSPAAVFGRLNALGGRLPPTYLVGCVPADMDEGIGLSEPVAEAVPHAAAAVISVIERVLPRVGVSARDERPEGAGE